MSDLQKQVIEFHQKFGQPIATSPSVPSDELVRFRARLITEEFLETLQAMFDMSDVEGSAVGAGDAVLKAAGTLRFVVEHTRVKVDLVELADGLADLDYVVEGTRLAFGLDGGPIAREVHRSNMAKQPDPERPGGKPLKPDGWTPPNIAGEIGLQQGYPDTYGLAQRLEYLALRKDIERNR